MSETWNVKQIAELLKLSKRRVQILVNEEVLPRDGRGKYSPVKCVHAYINYLKELADGKGSTRLLDVRVRNLEESALEREDKRKVRRGELIDVSTYEKIIFEKNRQARDALFQIPDRTFALLASKLKITKKKFLLVRTILLKEVREIASEFSNNGINPRRKNN